MRSQSDISDVVSLFLEPRANARRERALSYLASCMVMTARTRPCCADTSVAAGREWAD